MVWYYLTVKLKQKSPRMTPSLCPEVSMILPMNVEGNISA